MLKGLVSGPRLLPPRVVVYGPQGIGKTTFAAGSRRPIFLPTERGADVVGPDRITSRPDVDGAVLESWEDFYGALCSVAQEKHDYATVVVDSADWLERLIFQDVVDKYEKKIANIEDIGYAKGYVFAMERWRAVLTQLDACVSRGMAVVIVAHATIRRFDSPEVEPFDRYGIKLHEGKGDGKANASALLTEWADVVGFCCEETKTKSTEVGFKQEVRRGWSTGKRVMRVVAQPGFVAKNRYGIKDAIALPDDGTGWEKLEEAILDRAAKQSARDIGKNGIEKMDEATK